MSSKKRIFMMFCVLIPIFFLLWEVTVTFRNVTTLKVDENNMFLDIEYKQFKAKNEIDNLEAVLDRFDLIPPLSLDSKPLNFGLSANFYLLKLKNVGTKSLDLTIMLDNPTTDSVDIYKVPDVSQPLYELGSSRTDNSISQKALPSIRFHLQPIETSTLLIKTRTDGTPNLPLIIFETEKFQQYKDAVYLLWGGFIAIVLLMSIYNLILFIGNGDKLYLFYIGYAFMFLTVLSIIHGFGSYLFPKTLLSLLNQNLIFFYYWIGVFLTLFTLYFLKLQKKHPKIKKMVLGFTALLGGLSLTSLFMPEYIAAQLFFTMQSLMYIMCLAMVIKSFGTSAKWAKFYIISWLPLLIGAGIGTMLMMGELDYSFFTRHAALLGVLFEMTFISMALAERLRQSESERLYYATHDQTFDMPYVNQINPELLATDESVSSINSFSLISVQVEKFEFLLGILDKSELVHAIVTFVEDMKSNLSNDLMLLNIDKQFNKTVGIIDGNTFAFFVSSNDAVLLKSVIEKITSKQSIIYRVDSLDISIKYRIGVATIQKDDIDIDKLMHQSNLAILKAKLLQLPFCFFDKELEIEHDADKTLARQLQEQIQLNELNINLKYIDPIEPKMAKLVIPTVNIHNNKLEQFGDIFSIDENMFIFTKEFGFLEGFTKLYINESLKLFSANETEKKTMLLIKIDSSMVTQSWFASYFSFVLMNNNINPKSLLIEVLDAESLFDKKLLDSSIRELKHSGVMVSFKLGRLPDSNLIDIISASVDYLILSNAMLGIRLNRLNHNFEMMLLNELKKELQVSFIIEDLGEKLDIEKLRESGIVYSINGI